jgi:lysophospholipase L1-like esterase
MTIAVKYTESQMETLKKENLNCLKNAENLLRDASVLVGYHKAILEEEEKIGYPVNTAIRPIPKIEEDCYDWYARHSEKCRQVENNKYDLIFIGDSITHFWEEVNGPETWKRYYGNRKVLNIGFGWDRTQNVLWRLGNGEFKNQRPKQVVLNIGTNNLTCNRVRGSTHEELVEAIEAICAFIHGQSPGTKILIMDIFPRGLKSEELFRRIIAVNAILDERMKDRPNIALMNIGKKFLNDKGDVDKDLFPDGTHPNEKGYQIWAESIEPVLKEGLSIKP